jgi:hypothetical protein
MAAITNGGKLVEQDKQEAAPTNEAVEAYTAQAACEDFIITTMANGNPSPDMVMAVAQLINSLKGHPPQA